MSRSTDPGHFFQTSDSIATSKRRAAKSGNKHGNPLDLKSKLLAVLASSDIDGHVFVAGADGVALKVHLETQKIATTYTGPTAPLTSLALSHSSTPADNQILFAGCWDKTIHSWSVATGRPLRRYTAHTDFVKCLLTTRVADRNLLISGGADAAIIVWDLADGRKLHTLKGHARGVLDLAVDPAASTADTIVLFSADSVREIRRWSISKDAAVPLPDAEPLVAHETSVNRLCFEPLVRSDDAPPEADLWTASSDKAAKRLVRDRAWQSDTVLEHPDFVKDVVMAGQWIVTACRDEDVRVWDASSGKLQCVYRGHFEEVTGLSVSESGRSVVSVSLDGTLRQWSLDAEVMRKTAQTADEDVEEQPAPEEPQVGLMTADEEAELAELMDSD